MEMPFAELMAAICAPAGSERSVKLLSASNLKPVRTNLSMMSLATSLLTCVMQSGSSARSRTLAYSSVLSSSALVLSPLAVSATAAPIAPSSSIPTNSPFRLSFSTRGSSRSVAASTVCVQATSNAVSWYSSCSRRYFSWSFPTIAQFLRCSSPLHFSLNFFWMAASSSPSCSSWSTLTRPPEAASKLCSKMVNLNSSASPLDCRKSVKLLASGRESRREASLGLASRLAVFLRALQRATQSARHFFLMISLLLFCTSWCSRMLSRMIYSVNFSSKPGQSCECMCARVWKRYGKSGMFCCLTQRRAYGVPAEFSMSMSICSWGSGAQLTSKRYQWAPLRPQPQQCPETASPRCTKMYIRWYSSLRLSTSCSSRSTIASLSPSRRPSPSSSSSRGNRSAHPSSSLAYWWHSSTFLASIWSALICSRTLFLRSTRVRLRWSFCPCCWRCLSMQGSRQRMKSKVSFS